MNTEITEITEIKIEIRRLEANTSALHRKHRNISVISVISLNIRPFLPENKTIIICKIISIFIILIIYYKYRLFSPPEPKVGKGCRNTEISEITEMYLAFPDKARKLDEWLLGEDEYADW